VASHAEQPVSSQHYQKLGIQYAMDGIFLSTTYVFVLIGLFLLWRTAQRSHFFWSTKLVTGTMLLGFGIFNIVEGIVDHHVLGIHHVNETVARNQWHLWISPSLFRA